ncbi:hypothetical protein B4U84_00240 [Westiellopsis prolifica IICB1]|nr:hypothetical protein B4U84_00240 [Westiellopsis prolifica IICB1]
MKFLLFLTLIITIAGCNILGINSGKERLPEVGALPLPKLPEWIEQISPIGEAAPLNQVRIRFKEALIPVESLDSSEQQNLLQKFAIEPRLPGQFRFLTPRMVGFQADKALPKATRFQVTLKAGLADLKNHRLEKDLVWSFNTEPIKITNLPGKNPVENSEIEPIDLQPSLQVTSNVELDLASVQEHVHLIPDGKNKGVGLKVELAKKDKPGENQAPLEKFDPSAQSWIYNLVPQQSLEKAKNYRLEFEQGIRPVYGNLASDKPFVSKVSTYAPLAFQGIKFYGQPDAAGAYGRFVKGSPQLEFNNGLVADTAIENIKVNPAPKSIARLLQVNDKDKIISINPYALEPTTSYTITIGGNLKDQFGQSLGKPVTVRYNSGDLAGDIWVPDGLNIFPVGKDLQLNIATVNLPEAKYKAAYRVVEPTDLVYFNSAYPKGDNNDLLPKVSNWQSFKVASKKNQPLEVNVPLREKLNSATGMLAYGVQARTNKYQENGKDVWREHTTYGLVQLTNLGVFSQWFPDAGLIRVHHLADGSPVQAADIQIYPSKLEAKSRPQPVSCAAGQTDENGSLRLTKENLQQCFDGQQSFVSPPQLLVIARENQDWAFARTEEYSGAYGYGIYADWNDGKPGSRGVIFSDRQLYQPGEKAWLTGFADYLQNGVIQQDKNAAYQLTLINSNGQKTDLGTKTTNEFGTFSVELPINKTQPLGYYTIQAQGKNGKEITGEFRVAEFKPPNFKVELNLDQEFALINQKVEANATSNYLFGAPTEGGKAKYFVTRQQANFIPKGWEEFSFGKQWFWPEEPPSVPSDVLQTNTQLDANGKTSQTIMIAKDLPYPMTYRVDVEVTDVSNLAVANSKTFTALPSDRLIGLKSNFVAEAFKAFPIEVIVTDPTGKLLSGQRVRLELQQMKYNSVTQVVEGSRTPKNQVEYKTVGQTEVTSTNNPQSVSLTPTESGSYRIRASFSDCRDVTCNVSTDLQIWATGENPVYWGSQERDHIEVKLDKQEFKLGETASALIQSPYSEGELYFAVIKDKPLYQQVIKIKGGAPQIQFPVTSDMLPNAAVEAVLVRQGKPLDQVEPGSIDKLVKIGFAPFKVNLQDKYLKVQVTPQLTTVAPGTEQTLQLQLQNNQGNPTKGQLTVMVVNEAVLQLSGYRPPNLVNTVYAEQAIATRFSDNRPQVVVEQANLAEPKGWGYGGGLSAGAANTRIRKDFQPLAYYNGSVVTDNDGKAQITFKLPDDLTTWRVMVVATDGNLKFGNGETTFLTTKPLLTNAILPQFARPGDNFQAGLTVTNNTGKTGSLNINGKVSGTVQFTNKNPHTANLQTKAESATQAYRFPIVATNVGESKIRFITKLNNIAADAFEVPLEIQPLTITEQVVETGVTNKQVKIPFNVEKNTVPQEGGLDIQLASTLIPEIKAPAQEVWQNNDLPFAEPAASQLLIAANLQTLSEKYHQTFAEFNFTQNLSQAVEKLQKLQLSDGGFAAFPGQEKSDPWVSAYTAESLATANQVFPNYIDTTMVSRLKGYLQKILANPGKYEFCKQQPCKSQMQLNALIAIAELGDKRNTFVTDIYQQRQSLDTVTQIKLARYLSQLSEWQDESNLLLKQLQQYIYETGRTATVSLPRSWGWMSSPTTAQAQALRLFISQQAKPEIIDRLLQSLLSLRRDGTWQTSYDNAQALTALVEYAQLEPTSPNFVATVQLAGRKLAEAKFTRGSNPSAEIKVPMDKLPHGRHDLQLQKSGQGNLHYLVAYRYRLPGNQPGRYNGLRVSRAIRGIDEQKVLQKTNIYALDKPLALKTGQVFDIDLEIIADHPVEHVVITDPLPAGFEAVDESFQTANSALQTPTDSWELGYKNIYRDRIVAYANHLEPGVYNLHYLVRSVTPGTFSYPGTEAHLQYAPEEFGRAAESTLVLEEKN